ncbi:MAG: histidine-type phosphatase [Bacteroidota bacterium]
MKKIILAALCCAGVVHFAIAQQSCTQPFLGSKALYKSQQLQYGPVPRGYKPVFINHAGRHGARHLTKDVSTYPLYQLLADAEKANALTKAGKLLKEKTDRLQKVEKNYLKSISVEGVNEQYGLANRTYANYSNVFKTQKLVLHIDYTKEIRTLQTCDAFVAELKTKINNNDTLITKKINDTTLRFYDMSAAYTAYKDSGYWKKYLTQLKDLENYTAIANKIAATFFTASFLKTHAGAAEKIASDLYGFITIFYSVQSEIINAGYTLTQVDMREFIDCNSLHILSVIDDAEAFYEKGPGDNINGIQVTIAAPLLEDFIKAADEYIATQSMNAKLRFCHAETIAPIAALMGLENASKPTNKVKDVYGIWRDDKVIPLSSNIQWVFYKKPGANKYLVKFLLNEKEVKVNGIPATQYRNYYNWDDVSAFYVNKLQNLASGSHPM